MIGVPRRRRARWLLAGAVMAATVAAAGGVAAAVAGSDGPPDYGVPEQVREQAWCADRAAFQAAVDADLPALAAGSPVAGVDAAAFLADHAAVVFAYEENALPAVGAGPPTQISWLHEIAAEPGLHDPAPFVTAETEVVLWSTTTC